MTRKKFGVKVIPFVLSAVLFLGTGIGICDEFTKADLEKWTKEFMSVVQQGEQLFHSNKLGKNTVSCDMCHPNGANTHPETYPKFQKQIGKVVALRDMINWCIQNPLEGETLKAEDPRMIALEAYITWERRGKALEPGKH